MHAIRSHNRGFSLTGIFLALIIGSTILLGGIYVWQKARPKSSSHAANTGHVTSPSGRFWIMSATVLDEVAIDPGARTAISDDTIFVPSYNSKKQIPQTNGLHIIPTQNFTSEAALAHSLTNGTIEQGTKALLYDNEPWSLTPSDEQTNPLAYYQKAAQLAHAHGYILIGTPVSKTDPRIAEQIAPYIDVLDIQAQSVQATVGEYSGKVLPIAHAARSANSKLTILSGLSTNPPAGVPTDMQLVSDANSVKGAVQGHWLNIPAPGTACPECHAPEPQIGVKFLDNLGAAK